MCVFRKCLVGQYCKIEVFGLNKIVDDFDDSILLHLMENYLLYKNEVDLWYGIFCIIFILLLVCLLF